MPLLPSSLALGPIFESSTLRSRVLWVAQSLRGGNGGCRKAPASVLRACGFRRNHPACPTLSRSSLRKTLWDPADVSCPSFGSAAAAERSPSLTEAASEPLREPPGVERELLHREAQTGPLLRTLPAAARSLWTLRKGRVQCGYGCGTRPTRTPGLWEPAASASPASDGGFPREW